MSTSPAVVACWPLFGLEVRTPRLTLRYPDDAAVAALMELAATGIHDPSRMPFAVPWTRFEPPYFQQQGMQHHWRTRAAISPQTWALPLAVYESERLVGVQELLGNGFLVTRTVETGSWLARVEQGKGIGKEMRSAVLHLAFAGLGAHVATTGAWADNAASIGVTRSLGYADNGWDLMDREGAQVKHLRFVLTREAWEPGRRDDVAISGLDACLPLLGLES